MLGTHNCVLFCGLLVGILKSYFWAKKCNLGSLAVNECIQIMQSKIRECRDGTKYTMYTKIYRTHAFEILLLLLISAIRSIVGNCNKTVVSIYNRKPVCAWSNDYFNVFLKIFTALSKRWKTFWIPEYSPMQWSLVRNAVELILYIPVDITFAMCIAKQCFC